MKTALSQRRHCRGIMILECLVYMAVLFIVTGIATEVFYRCWESSQALRRQTDDVSRSLQAGEQWRADVRGAQGSPASEMVGGWPAFRIPGPAGETVYTLHGKELRRQHAPDPREQVLLSNVKSSEMRVEPHGGVTICRWEMELEPRAKHGGGRLVPLFTFAAASGKGGEHAH
ncbi:MAG TPA: hypothetical protein VHB20_16275 [Verrucomicrobiae bacterium]|jgi:hypothetical protein|nr:hypothetical protein [Verrucomicrobiae bacterium]